MDLCLFLDYAFCLVIWIIKSAVLVHPTSPKINCPQKRLISRLFNESAQLTDQSMLHRKRALIATLIGPILGHVWHSLLDRISEY